MKRVTPWVFHSTIFVDALRVAEGKIQVIRGRATPSRWHQLDVQDACQWLGCARRNISLAEATLKGRR